MNPILDASHSDDRIIRAVTRACSVMVCLGAQRRSAALGARVEPNATALADMHAVMRELPDERGRELAEALNYALDILSGERMP